MKYQRIIHRKNDIEDFRYTRDGVFVKADRVPQDVMVKFEYTPTVEYDDQPDKPRCLFCDAPRSHQRYVTGLMVPLCDHHYYTENIGRITAQLRLLKEQGEKDGVQQKKSIGSTTKWNKRTKRQDARSNPTPARASS